MKASNLLSAFQHTHIIDEEIAKECDAGRILGPFETPQLESLKCSGVGVVPKKNGKWRRHLSAPAGQSINDGKAKEDFSMHYSSVVDATRILSRLGKGAFLPKRDLKSAFRMVPVQSQDWELLSIHWKQAFYVDTCLPFGLCSAVQKPYSGYCRITMAFNASSTTWMTTSSLPQQTSRSASTSLQSSCKSASYSTS